MSKPTLNRHQVARHLDRVALTSKDKELAAAAAALVQQIDAGAGSIPAKLDAFLATAWMTAARGVAAGTKRVASLREIAALESALGLEPEDDETDTDSVNETVNESATETVTDSDTETDSVDDTGTDSASYSSYAYGSAS